MIGTTVGSYRIIDKLSVGGMGTVYRAEHTLIGRPAAVKILHPELSANQEIVDRFFIEAKATTSIKHPGIVDVFDFGYMESGHAFLVMEFLEGMSLAKRLKDARMSEGHAALILRGVCMALNAAHEQHIVHRDLKPDNIFLVPDPDSAIGERPKILDFGIAKLTDIGMASSATKTGAVMGTPTYMSPEQCRGTGQVDHRADLYSIGCMFYEMITGRPPFTNLGAGELIGAHLYVPPQPPSKYLPTITADTLALIMTLLEKKPEKRVQTAVELAARLLAIAHAHDLGTNTPSSMTLPPLPAPTPPPSLDGPDDELIREIAARAAATNPPVAEPRATSEPPKPTTLSGAVTSSIIDLPKRSRKGLLAGIAAGVLVAVAGVALVLRGGGDGAGTGVVTAPTSAPAPTPPVVAAPVTLPEPTPEPAIVDAAVVATEPEPPPPTAVVATVPEPPPPTPVVATPVGAKAVAAKKRPVAKAPKKAVAKPLVQKPVKPPPKKPTLIETEL